MSGCPEPLPSRDDGGALAEGRSDGATWIHVSGVFLRGAFLTSGWRWNCCGLYGDHRVYSPA